MKKKKYAVLCLFLVMLFALPFTAQAASKKSKALKAYSKLLSGRKISWGHGSESNPGFKVPLKNCDFALAYVDGDSVPELILYNVADAPHIAGYGAMYTYRSGKAVLVTTLDMNDGDFSYYKKKGVFADNDVSGGYLIEQYYRFTKSAVQWQQTKSDGRATFRPGIRYYENAGDGRSAEITKKSFNKKLKKLTKNAKSVKAVFHKNTAVNRKKYLK